VRRKSWEGYSTRRFKEAGSSKDRVRRKSWGRLQHTPRRQTILMIRWDGNLGKVTAHADSRRQAVIKIRWDGNLGKVTQHADSMRQALLKIQWDGNTWESYSTRQFKNITPTLILLVTRIAYNANLLSDKRFVGFSLRDSNHRYVRNFKCMGKRVYYLATFRFVVIMLSLYILQHITLHKLRAFRSPAPRPSFGCASSAEPLVRMKPLRNWNLRN
jgi:hypothetical protein